MYSEIANFHREAANLAFLHQFSYLLKSGSLQYKNKKSDMSFCMTFLVRRAQSLQTLVSDLDFPKNSEKFYFRNGSKIFHCFSENPSH